MSYLLPVVLFWGSSAIEEVVRCVTYSDVLVCRKTLVILWLDAPPSHATVILVVAHEITADAGPLAINPGDS